jgi:hypothetical protein
MHIHKYLNAGCRHNIHNTKEFILSVVSEEFEYTKGIIRRTRQHNGYKKKDERTNNDLQNITHKTKDRVTASSVNIYIISINRIIKLQIN